MINGETNITFRKQNVLDVFNGYSKFIESN